MGCTHYPILSKVIQKVIGENVSLIDSGVASAEIIKEDLSGRKMLNDSGRAGVLEFFVSDIPTKFREVAELFLGREINGVHKVELEELITN